jgi:response regulator RpfG family c-di-GMP phosphodiesterase
VAPSLPAPHIVVVDDEPQIRDILATTLRRDGFRVSSHGCARDALAEIARGPVHLVVTDLKMPEMNGIELIKEAKRAVPGIGSVLITAYASTETAVLALRHGADDYLMKPFGLEDIRRVVERVLAERSRAGEEQAALVTAREENERLRVERRVAEEALLGVQEDLALSRRDLERRVRDLSFVTTLTELLAAEEDLERVLRTTCRIAALRFHALVTRIEVDAGDGLVDAEHREGADRVPLSSTLGAELIRRAMADPSGAIRDEILGQGRPLEGLAAAIRRGERCHGGLVLLRPLLPREDGGDDADVALLRMIPRALLPVLDADRHRRRAERGSLEIAASILRAMEGRGLVHRGHAERVADLARQAASHLDLDPGQRRALETSARLHDIGEVGVPEELLSRPGPLSSAEMDVVRAHAVLGARMLEPLGEAARYVRHHHERPDGSGYPDGIRGRDIPLGAGVIGVAEAFDAMTHARPYRPALTSAQAREEIRRGRGTQFVPEAADALLEVIPT